jgi:hypothetical protein
MWISTALKSVDFYSKSFTMNVDSNVEHSTPLGGIGTILQFGAILTLALVLLVDQALIYNEVRTEFSEVNKALSYTDRSLLIKPLNTSYFWIELKFPDDPTYGYPVISNGTHRAPFVSCNSPIIKVNMSFIFFISFKYRTEEITFYGKQMLIMNFSSQLL